MYVCVCGIETGEKKKTRTAGAIKAHKVYKVGDNGRTANGIIMSAVIWVFVLL